MSATPLHDLTIHPHGRVLLLDPRSKRLQVPVENANAVPVGGVVEVTLESRGAPIAASACFQVAPDGSALLQVPVSRELVSDAELFARFEVRLAVGLTAPDGQKVRTAARYLLRTGRRS